MKVYDDDITLKSKLVESGFINLTCNDIVVIKGSNGSGKTLLLKNILHNDKNTFKINMVDQNNNCFFYNLNINDNIYFNSSLKSLDNINIYKDFMNKNPNKLSGGERRLINIFRGIESDSDIVLFDEPTNDLDNDSVNLFISLLKNLNKIVIIVTHDDRLFSLANKIYKIENKQLILKDSIVKTKNISINKIITTDSVLVSNKFKKMYKFSLLNLLIVLYLTTLLLFSFYNFKIEYKTINSKLKDNEIIISDVLYTKNSTDEKAYQITIHEVFDTYNYYYMALNTNKIINKDYKNTLSKRLGIILIESKEYKLYPTIYYNPLTNHTINIIQEYSKYLNLDYKQIDTSQYFSNKVNEENKVELNIDIYNKLVNDISSDYICMNVHLVYNDDFNFEQFNKTQFYNQNNHENIYTKSKEITYLVNDVSNLLNIISSLTIYTTFLFILLLMVLIIDILFLFSKKNEFITLSNYKIDKYKTYDIFKKKNNSQIISVSSIIILLILNILFKNYIFYIFIIIYYISLNLIYFLRNKTFKIFINKFFYWGIR